MGATQPGGCSPAEVSPSQSSLRVLQYRRYCTSPDPVFSAISVYSGHRGCGGGREEGLCNGGLRFDFVFVCLCIILSYQSLARKHDRARLLLGRSAALLQAHGHKGKHSHRRTKRHNPKHQKIKESRKIKEKTNET